MTDYIIQHWPVIVAYIAGVISPFVIPKSFDFLIARGLERYKLRIIQAQKGDKIAELFSYMPRIIGGSPAISPDQELRINQLILELSIYLPKDLVCELSETFVCPHKRPLYKNTLVKIRKEILYPRGIFGRQRDDGLIGDNILHFQLIPAGVLASAPVSPLPQQSQQ